MTVVAQRLAAIRPSATLAVSAKARALQAQGLPVLSLTTGEPDFDTPPSIQDAGIRAIRDGHTRYTDTTGLPELKQAIIAKFRRENNLHFGADQIIAATGAKQILFNAFMASLDPLDEVIIPAPYWVSYPEMVQIAGGVPVLVACPAEQGFKLLPQQLQQAITPRGKWLVLNGPNNPTGALYSRDELLALAEILRQHPHIYVLSDDIYEHIRFDGAPFHTLAEVAPDLAGRILTVNGVSKSYAMTGWRLGYAGGPVQLVKAMALLQGQSTSNPCSIAQMAAIEALNGPQDAVREMCIRYEQRRNAMVKHISAIEGLSVVSPAGAFYLYIDCSGVLGKATPQGMTLRNEADFIAYLLDVHHVAVVPGEAFGLSPYFRVTFAIADDMIETACTRIRQACEALV